MPTPTKTVLKRAGKMLDFLKQAVITSSCKGFSQVNAVAGPDASLLPSANHHPAQLTRNK
jgi:hypothetical protein